jgi:hypothetical protein
MLTQKLLQLRTQLDRTRLLDSHRMIRWIMGGRIHSGPSRLASMISVRARRTRGSCANGHTGSHPGRGRP